MLSTGRTGGPVVQRRGNLAPAVPGNLQMDKILTEIREEYSFDPVLAARLEEKHGELSLKKNLQFTEVNRRLIIPLNKALAARAAPQRHSDTLADSKAMDVATANHDILVPLLIAKWDWNEETITQKADQVFNLNNNDVASSGVTNETVSNKQGWRFRIDREGPAQNGTAAQFRLQFGTATYAGIHLRLNQKIGARYIRDAWHQSYNAGRSVHVYMQ
jgi:hypothetical protein